MFPVFERKAAGMTDPETGNTKNMCCINNIDLQILTLQKLFWF
jgi:hypothetical protein